jgi:hyperosmotically inducible protein
MPAANPDKVSLIRLPAASFKGTRMSTITSKLASLAGVLLVATTLGCASTATHEGTGEYVDDTVLTTKVKTAIFSEPTLKSAEINVETFKGVVQLSGFVSSHDAENKAVHVASAVKGVKSVKNDMRVK